MSYAQYGYTYPPPSQFLVAGQHSTPSYCDPDQTTMTADVQSGQHPAGVCSLPSAYESRLISAYPRLTNGLSVSGLYGGTYPDQASYVTSFAGNPAALYSSPLTAAYDLKDTRTWSSLSQAAACYPYDPAFAAYSPYADRFDPVDSAARRRNATRETTNTLKAWLNEHRKNPYPTKGEKIMLAIITKMTLTQVSTWFANARRRLKKENKMTWEPRNKVNDPSEEEDDDDDEDDDDITDKRSIEEKIKTEISDEFPTGSHIKVECKSECSEEDRKLRSTPDSGKELRAASSDNAENGSTSPALNEGLRTPDSVQKTTSESSMTDLDITADKGLISEKPKIWSLAHTATSESPPPVRRSPYSIHSIQDALRSRAASMGNFVTDRICSSNNLVLKDSMTSDRHFNESSAESSLSSPTLWINDSSPKCEASGNSNSEVGTKHQNNPGTVSPDYFPSISPNEMSVPPSLKSSSSQLQFRFKSVDHKLPSSAVISSSEFHYPVLTSHQQSAMNTFETSFDNKSTPPSLISKYSKDNSADYMAERIGRPLIGQGQRADDSSELKEYINHPRPLSDLALRLGTAAFRPVFRRL